MYIWEPLKTCKRQVKSLQLKCPDNIGNIPSDAVRYLVCSVHMYVEECACPPPSCRVREEKILCPVQLDPTVVGQRGECGLGKGCHAYQFVHGCALGSQCISCCTCGARNLGQVSHRVQVLVSWCCIPPKCSPSGVRCPICVLLNTEVHVRYL